MANNYLQSSFAVKFPENVCDWAYHFYQNILEGAEYTIGALDSDDSFVDKEYRSDVEEFLKSYVYHVNSEDAEDDYYDIHAGFTVKLDGEATLWISAEESGDPSMMAHFLQYVLQKFHLEKMIMFEWSETCSKMRVGEFGGGSCLITQDDIFYMNTSSIETYYKASKLLEQVTGLIG